MVDIRLRAMNSESQVYKNIGDENQIKQVRKVALEEVNNTCAYCAVVQENYLHLHLRHDNNYYINHWRDNTKQMLAKGLYQDCRAMIQGVESTKRLFDVLCNACHMTQHVSNGFRLGMLKFAATKFPQVELIKMYRTGLMYKPFIQDQLWFVLAQDIVSDLFFKVEKGVVNFDSTVDCFLKSGDEEKRTHFKLSELKIVFTDKFRSDGNKGQVIKVKPEMSDDEFELEQIKAKMKKLANG